MKVYVYVKYQPNPDTKGTGMQEKDICYIYPIGADQGKLTLNTFFPVIVDLNIPCGQGLVPGMDFTVTGNPNWACTRCPYNDVTLCDVRKYTVAVWDAGDVFNSPKVIKKRMHSINYDLFLNAQQITKMRTLDKTESEKNNIFTISATKEQLETIIEVKK